MSEPVLVIHADLPPPEESEFWCSHPDWFGFRGDERPATAKMVGVCPHNMACPTCGFGWGALPDPCQITNPFQAPPSPEGSTE